MGKDEENGRDKDIDVKMLKIKRGGNLSNIWSEYSSCQFAGGTWLVMALCIWYNFRMMYLFSRNCTSSFDF